MQSTIYGCRTANYRSVFNVYTVPVAIPLSYLCLQYVSFCLRWTCAMTINNHFADVTESYSNFDTMILCIRLVVVCAVQILSKNEYEHLYISLWQSWWFCRDTGYCSLFPTADRVSQTFHWGSGSLKDAVKSNEMEDGGKCNFCFWSLSDCFLPSSLSPPILVLWLFPHHCYLCLWDFSKHCSNSASVSSFFRVWVLSQELFITKSSIVLLLKIHTLHIAAERHRYSTVLATV